MFSRLFNFFRGTLKMEDKFNDTDISIETNAFIDSLDDQIEGMEVQKKKNPNELPVVDLYRFMRSDQGTRGKLHFNDFACHTLELPWKNNQRNMSCIPPGSYKCTTRISPKFGLTYWLLEVPNRSYILIHSGNWAGDVEKGFKSHVNGCILLGLQSGYLQGQWAVLNSRITVTKFMNIMDQQPFTLVIHDSMI